MKFLIALLLASCGSKYTNKPCGDDPRMKPVAIGGSMVVACQLGPDPSARTKERLHGEETTHRVRGQ